jgi:serine/threonine protein kinase
MRKNDKDINKITKRLKTLKMARRNGGDLPTYACIYTNRLEFSISGQITPEWSANINPSDIITKVLTNSDQYQKELHVAQHLRSTMSAAGIQDQQHILYVVKAYSFKKSEFTANELDIFNRCEVDKPKEGIINFDKSAEDLYALEYYNGGINLAQFLENRENYNDDLICKIVRDIDSLVEKLHSFGVAHRDLGNPSNYTIKDNEVYLIDFGEAEITHDFTYDDERLLEGLKEIIRKKRGIPNVRTYTKSQILNLCTPEMSEEEKASERARRAAEFTANTNAYGSPEKQGTPPSTQFDSPPPSGRKLFNSFDSPSPPKKPRQEGGKKK